MTHPSQSIVSSIVNTVSEDLLRSTSSSIDRRVFAFHVLHRSICICHPSRDNYAAILSLLRQTVIAGAMYYVFQILLLKFYVPWHVEINDNIYQLHWHGCTIILYVLGCIVSDETLKFNGSTLNQLDIRMYCICFTICSIHYKCTSWSQGVLHW